MRFLPILIDISSLSLQEVKWNILPKNCLYGSFLLITSRIIAKIAERCSNRLPLSPPSPAEAG
jgi:hypothetical protein